MQQILIDASFLDSCFQTFLNSSFYETADDSFFPLKYETIIHNFIGLFKKIKKIEISQYSSYTGFIASFYLDGQLELFAYVKDGMIDIFIDLNKGIEGGTSSYYLEYSQQLIPCGGRYENGKSIEPPFIWGHEDIITEINFLKWVEQEIHYVINSGLYHQKKKSSIRKEPEITNSVIQAHDLIGVDLIGADLRGANLSGANLSDTDLRGANLSNADLTNADLRFAFLSKTDLSGANLSRVNLSRANLNGANLSRADLSEVNLSGANLNGVYLIETILRRTDFTDSEVNNAWFCDNQGISEDLKNDLIRRGAIF